MGVCRPLALPMDFGAVLRRCSTAHSTFDYNRYLGFGESLHARAAAALPPASTSGAERRAPPKAGLLLLMPGGVQQQPSHARIPHVRGAMPVHEREPAYASFERVPRISIITNLDYNEVSCILQSIRRSCSSRAHTSSKRHRGHTVAKAKRPVWRRCP